MPHVHNALHSFTALQSAYRVAVQEADPGFTGIERAGETLTPTLDLWSQPEWALPRGEVMFARGAAVAAVPGRFSGIELVNPVGSRHLARVDRVRIASVAPWLGGPAFLVTDSGGALGTTVTTQGIPRDTRYAQLGAVSVCTVVTGDYAGGASLEQVLLNAGEEITEPYVIAPGTKLWLISTVVNAVLGGMFFWSERAASQDELARFG